MAGVQAFPAAVQWKLDTDGVTIVADGFDPNDIDVPIMATMQCAICRCDVQNVREYKQQHVAWHNKIDSTLGATLGVAITKTTAR